MKKQAFSVIFWWLDLGGEGKRASELTQKWADLGYIRPLPKVLLIYFVGLLEPESVSVSEALKINFSPKLIPQCCVSLILQSKFELCLPKIPAPFAGGDAETLEKGLYSQFIKLTLVGQAC